MTPVSFPKIHQHVFRKTRTCILKNTYMNLSDRETKKTGRRKPYPVSRGECSS